MENLNEISCSNCGTQIVVEQALAAQHKERLTNQLRGEYKEHFNKLETEKQELLKKQQQLEQQQNQFDTVLAEKLLDEKQKLQTTLKKQLLDEHAAELTALKEESERKQKLVEQAKLREIELERKQNELRIKEQDLQLSFEKKLAEYQQQQQAQFKARMQEELQNHEAEITRKVSEENQLRLAAQTKELTEKQEQIRVLREKELLFEKQQRQHEDEKRELEIKFEQQQAEIRRQLEEAISKRVHEQNELKLREKDEIIRQMREQVEEAKRKAEQGSMQLQGEVQELALEELLRDNFPMDEVGEVGKGIRGADVVHTVRNSQFQECGKILYESKRTKHFSADWIAKLKADRAIVKADLCVIVTEALPEGIDRIGLREDVWICTYHDAKGLIIALRESLIACHRLAASQSNKGEKMQMLYDFLTGSEFRQQIMAMIEGYNALKDQLLKERRVMETQWAMRDKQLERVLLNTQHFYGSIRGIAGSAVPLIASLEPESLLPESDTAMLSDESAIPLN